jgi:hypothetical protein
MNVMIAIFVALGVMMVAGLIAIPAAQAVSRSDLDRQIRGESQVDAGLHGGRPTG